MTAQELINRILLEAKKDPEILTRRVLVGGVNDTYLAEGCYSEPCTPDPDARKQVSTSGPNHIYIWWE